MTGSDREAISLLPEREVPYFSLCVHQLISAQARRTPGAIAIRTQDNVVTYRELESRSNQLAAVLADRGAGRGALVALLIDRSPDMVAALLAILKSGAAYLPLDPSYSSTRLTDMLASSGAALLISEANVLNRLALNIETDVLLLDACASCEKDTEPVETTVEGEDSCYVIYTSGSTGEPKGVQVRHASLANLVSALKDNLAVTANDVVLSTVSISFDPAAPELFLPLIAGGRIELASQDELADPFRLAARMDSSGATVLSGTPAMWRLLLLAGWKGNGSPQIMCGGESVSQHLAAELMARSSKLWNCYGPTEATVTAAMAHVTDANCRIALGAPLANVTLHVLSEALSRVEPGESGELYIGGRGLAAGYWRRPDLTAERFSFVRLEGQPGIRLYSTGDRVRLLPDGGLEFLGRLDRQVKLRGFRIELGEIEQVAHRMPGVRDAAVLKVGDHGKGDFLAAYIVPHTGKTISADSLRRYFQEALPKYMVPAAIYVLERLPVTGNGKTDYRSLLQMEENQEAALEGPEDPPRSKLEKDMESIWCTILKRSKIGRHEDFFDAGGDSLLAAHLVATMSKRFSRKLGVASLHQAPTIALYAAFLSGRETAMCVVLNQGSTALQNQKMFWIDHPDRLYRLAGLMGAHPFYSILLTQEELAQEAPAYPMEQLAAFLVRRILVHQSEGSFYVGGFCQNAMLAYEVGRQLQGLGLDVPLLVMVDPVTPKGNIHRTSVLTRLQRRIQREQFHLLTMLQKKPSEWLAYLERRSIGIRFVLEGKQWQRRAQRGGKALPPATELAQALFVSQLTYKPKPYSGRVLFVQPTVRPRGKNQDALRHWQSLAGASCELEIFGDHLSLFGQPGVAILAEELKRGLQGREVEIRQTPAAHETDNRSGCLQHVV